MNADLLKKAYQNVLADFLSGATPKPIENLYQQEILLHFKNSHVDRASLVELGWLLHQEYARLEKEEHP